jgi:RNA polymerase sigma-70 factor (ECF subfamily)
MDGGRTRSPPIAARAELATRFFDAFRNGDIGGLRELLSADVQMVSDRGGKGPRWGEGIVGVDNVARAIVAGVTNARRLGN